MLISGIAHLIHAERYKLGMTQGDLERRSNLGKGYLSSFENGRIKDIKLSSLVEILDALELEIDIRPKTKVETT